MRHAKTAVPQRAVVFVCAEASGFSAWLTGPKTLFGRVAVEVLC